ncbi:MAG TPA: PEGA domain-containing protein [Bryobacteraceae bacterium]|nr:PEGA domain-containing protein [Bryobacteraceae bacterium]
MNPSDPTRVREEKAHLYQSALDAWQKGDVAAAMSTLERLAAMDRDFPDPDAGRGSTYRNFYNQVHTESDAIKKAYEEARRHLAEGDLDAAGGICRQYLAKYPNQALFQALQSDVEGRKRQQSQPVAQAIVDTERKAEEEPDLDRRAALLEAAVKQYPGELHFLNSLKAVNDLRGVVNSMVAKARFFEERGQFSDALDQWQILKSIHPRQPGLAAEIQRLTSRRDQPPAPKPVAPAVPAVESEWAGHARKYLEAGDYQRAMQAVTIGLAESPDNPELKAIDQEVRQGQEQANRALELLGKAHETINKGSMDAGLAALREAHQLDPRNSVIRTVLVNGLLDQARKKADSDVASADALVQEVLRIEPNHAQAMVLAQGITDRKTATPPPVPPAAPLAPGPVGEAPTLAVPASVTQALLSSALPPPAPLPSPAATVPPPAKPPAPKPPTPKPPTPKPAPAAGIPKNLILGTAAAVGVLVIVALGVTLARHRQKPAPPPPSRFAVMVHSSPAGAEIKISGETCGVGTCNLQLAPGSYQISAQLTGYQPASMPMNLGPGSPKEFNVTLTPQGPKLTIFTDLAEGAVTMDDAPAGQIQGGGAEVANLTPGKHVLAVKGGDSAASIPIAIQPGAAPALAGPIDAKNARCLLVAGFGGSARVYAAGGNFRVTLDGKPLGALTADGLPLDGLTPGSHELVMDSDMGQHDRMVFESQPSPTLYLTVGTAQNLGTLSVETNEDQAHLFINGQKYRRDTARGRLVVYKSPGKYKVTVQKDGFAPVLEQTVEIKAGVDTKVSFTLTAAKSVLAVHHAPPGTDVQVDNISRGAAHADGEFQVGGIDPGKHTVTLRHDGFKTLQTEQVFTAGKTVDLQAAMEAAPTTGTLRFEIGPPGVDAHIRIRREGETQDREVSGPSVTVPEGRYTVSVLAPQYLPGMTTLQVSTGGTAVAALTLKKAEPKAPPKTTPTLVFGLEDWLKSPGWSSQNGMLVHKGGDWLMAPPDISHGTIRFTVVSLKGRHVEWVVADRDEKNFIHYELDDKNVTRYEVRNGSKLGQVKVAHGLDKKKPMGISLALTPQSVVMSVFRGGWVDIDKWDVEGSSVHGRFGFRLPGSDEIGLQEFQIVP